MFTKFFLQNYSNANQSKIFLCRKKSLCMFSVNMRNFILCRLVRKYFESSVIFTLRYQQMLTTKRATRNAFAIRRFYPSEILLVEAKENSPKSNFIQKFQAVDVSCSRNFLQFNGNLQGRNKEYQGKKLVGYSAEQMFDVVADVGKYESFLPFCKRSHVSFKSPTNIKAELVIGFPPLIESYISNVSLVKPQLIKAVCTEGKLFNYLLTTWKFSPGLKNNEKTCIIDFFVSFEFRSALHSHFANLFFNELVRQMEDAFYQEARQRYGRPSVSMQTLSVQRKNS